MRDRFSIPENKVNKMRYFCDVCYYFVTNWVLLSNKIQQNEFFQRKKVPRELIPGIFMQRYSFPLQTSATRNL